MGSILLNVALFALSWSGCNGMPVHILPIPRHHHEAHLDRRHHEDTQFVVKLPSTVHQVQNTPENHVLEPSTVHQVQKTPENHVLEPSTMHQVQNTRENNVLEPSTVHQVQNTRENHVLERLKKLEEHLKKKALAHAVAVPAHAAAAPAAGHLLVNGPLPVDFGDRFAQAVSQATGADTKVVHLMSTQRVNHEPGVVELSFSAPSDVVKLVEDQAAEPTSKLTSGTLHSFLVAKEDDQGKDQDAHEEHGKAHEAPQRSSRGEATPVMEKGIDVDTQLPFGDLEPFGREDTAQELTENAVGESDQMVDQIERAEVAEEKRSVFRALTRLRGAAISSFDGVARSQTSNIDQYNKVHKWRKAHPMHHLADEESDITKWAFPNVADLVQTNSTIRKRAAVPK